MQGFRPNAEQDADYAKGRTVRGAIVTGAKAGESPHNFQPSYAADVVLNPAVVAVAEREGYPDLWDEHSPDAVQAWADLEVVAAKYGLERVMLTGPHGPYRDKPHVQLHGWRSRIPH
jgi:peptidoglycan L-alanyl-D-glutamate endopeptidase CwlK